MINNICKVTMLKVQSKGRYLQQYTRSRGEVGSRSKGWRSESNSSPWISCL